MGSFLKSFSKYIPIWRRSRSTQRFTLTKKKGQQIWHSFNYQCKTYLVGNVLGNDSSSFQLQGEDVINQIVWFFFQSFFSAYIFRACRSQELGMDHLNYRNEQVCDAYSYFGLSIKISKLPGAGGGPGQGLSPFWQVTGCGQFGWARTKPTDTKMSTSSNFMVTLKGWTQTSTEVIGTSSSWTFIGRKSYNYRCNIKAETICQRR